ncbi:MAG: threonine synthase, partial [Clostridia bacterium]|nr:threonine synthase [Clostridia bacterium]
MDYKSTRNSGVKLMASQAIIKGISKDGGLFVPSRFPDLKESLEELVKLNYMQLAAKIMGVYLDEFYKNTLADYAVKAYSKYEAKEVVPVNALNDNIYMMELWHGPTLAFKDMALQMLPLLMTGSMQIQKQQDNILILVATSGDTGKAALAGFCDVDKTGICVFYPHDGVSKAQKLQMTTQDGENVM